MAKDKTKSKPKVELTAEEKAQRKAEKAEQDRLNRITIMEAAQKALVEKYHLEVRENNIRDFLLFETLRSFDAMRHANSKLQAELLVKQKWDDYVTCVNLPSGSDVPDLRAFLFAWQMELKDYFDSYTSWAIDVNERSLLNQDRSVRNMTFKKLWNEQPMIGEIFIGRMRKAYRLCHDIDVALHTIHTPFLKSELIEVREKFRKQMKSTVDLYAFRVLTNIERDMIKLDTHSARYNYESEIFRSAVWTTRPVPQIAKCWLVEPNHHIEFPAFECSLTCPEDLEIDGRSFRCLWTNYDHFSDTAPSWSLKVEDLHPPDLRTVIRADWAKMEELREAKLTEMIRVRVEWEEAEQKRIAMEEAAAKAKKSNKGEPDKKPKKKRKTKPRPEPPPADKDTIVSIDTEFEEYDENEYSKLQERTSPSTLGLAENEVNLRCFYMVGGIFEFSYLKRPTQFNQIQDDLLLRLDDGKILECIDYNPEFNAEADNFTELVEINVKLSDKVCWWTTPIIAYLEPWEESTEFRSLSPELQDFHLNYDKYVDKIRFRLFAEPSIKINPSIVKCVQDFRVDAFPHDIGFVEFIKFYLIPRIPLSYKFKSELDQEREALRKENLRRKEIEMEHQEEKDRKRRLFEEEMRLYKEEADAKRNEMIAKKRAEMEEERELTRIKLVNQGENDKQIEKHLKFKEQNDEKLLHDLDMEELLKYHDYYSEQYELQFRVDTASEESVVIHRAFAVKTLPADLYPPHSKQLPLRVSIPNHKSICFDCPTIKDNAEIEVDENENPDQMLLSTFLQYLNILYHKSFPKFRKHKLIGTQDPVQTSIDIIAPPLVTENRASTSSQRRKSSLVRSSIQVIMKPKAKGSKGKGKKDAKKDSSDTPKTDESVDRKGEKKKMSKTEAKKKSGKAENSPDRKTAKEQKRRSTHGTDSIWSQINDLSVKPSRHKVPPMQLIPHPAGKWMTDGIYFTDFDPTTGYIKYKTSHFGATGFAMPKYCNYPLKYWEVYPNLKKKMCVRLKIMGKFCLVKFEITEEGYIINKIMPNRINFEPNKIAMSYEALVKYLSESGIISFPSDDANHYINDVAEKHYVMETHTYMCMAQFSLSYYFRYSPFNSTLVRRSAMFESYQLHEESEMLDVKKLEFDEIMVSTLRANTVKSVLTPIGKHTHETKLEHLLMPEEQDLYPDVLSLLTSRSHEVSLKRYRQMKHTFRYNVARLLCAIRPLSFTT